MIEAVSIIIVGLFIGILLGMNHTGDIIKIKDGIKLKLKHIRIWIKLYSDMIKRKV